MINAITSGKQNSDTIIRHQTNTKTQKTSHQFSALKQNPTKRLQQLLSIDKTKNKRESMITEAYTKTTNSKHMVILNELQKFILDRRRSSSCPASTDQRGRKRETEVTPVEVEDYLWSRRERPRGRTQGAQLKWSTTRTLYGSLLGALRAAPLYGVAVTKADDPGWSRMERYLQKKVYAEPVKFPTPLKLSEVDAIVTLLTAKGERMAAMYMALWWVTAARPQDVLRLKSRNVCILPDGAMTVQFAEGKGVTIRGPYTVFTMSPPQWLHLFRQMPCTPELFPETIRKAVHECTMRTLRAVNGEAEARSVRRGALQSLALTGATDETLLSFSGHKEKKMLYRYLNWGKARAIGSKEGRLAAARAWASQCQIGS
jgi:hypothetical protein